MERNSWPFPIWIMIGPSIIIFEYFSFKKKERERERYHMKSTCPLGSTYFSNYMNGRKLVSSSIFSIFRSNQAGNLDVLSVQIHLSIFIIFHISA